MNLILGRTMAGRNSLMRLGWGLSGQDVDTAQREQRRARREVEAQLRASQQQLQSEADALLALAPRLGRPLAGEA